LEGLELAMNHLKDYEENGEMPTSGSRGGISTIYSKANDGT
jgi:hypothetical protein